MKALTEFLQPFLRSVAKHELVVVITEVFLHDVSDDPVKVHDDNLILFHARPAPEIDALALEFVDPVSSRMNH